MQVQKNKSNIEEHYSNFRNELCGKYSAKISKVAQAIFLFKIILYNHIFWLVV